MRRAASPPRRTAPLRRRETGAAIFPGDGRGCAHALTHAAGGSATTAWLFSRRSGPFWQRLGFVSADREELATVLADSHQVQSFRATGQLSREAAWSRPLSATVSDFDDPR